MPVAQTAPSPGYSGPPAGNQYQYPGPPAGNQYQYDPRAQVVMMGRLGRGWKNDLCDCLNNCNLCCTTICCPSCVLAQVAGRLRKYLCFGTFKTFLFFITIGNVISYCLYLGLNWDKSGNAYWSCYINCNSNNDIRTKVPIIWEILALCGMVSFLYSLYMLRGEVRRRRQIVGNECEDLLLSVFCGLCTLCQLATEVEADDRCCSVNEPEAFLEDGVHYSTQPYVNPDASGYSKV
jgi:Cys-rich protein (TIGR01571 family)